jgi:tRNA pseudouridine32 synthase/23S rRNA pseudouridine746 synthase
MGWPIVGDAIYGRAPRSGGPVLHLHAREVTVPLYKNRPPIRVVAPVPPHMRAALERCGWKESEAEPGELSFRAPSAAREPGIHKHNP